MVYYMERTTDPVLYWIGLNSIPGVGRSMFRKLVNRFGSPERALSASEDELKSVDRMSDKIVNGIREHAWHATAEGELAKACDAGVDIITEQNPSYPEQLRNTPDAPLFLYVRGTIEPVDRNALAIVGTRRPTHYGLSVTYRIARELASAGFTIVSGLARGIDTQAHRGALAANARTIAVLGSGIDIPYPPENRGLMNQIADSGHGAVITENAFGTQPEAGYFPARNRIISGLAIGTVIIEAAEDSGSLITADYALKQGRRLFAVPGNVGMPTSRGPNNLIKKGAVLVESAQDILNALPRASVYETATGRSAGPAIRLSPEEQAVFGRITSDPKHIDIIMTEAGTTAGRINGILMTLELKGLVKQLPGKYYTQSENWRN